MSTGAKVAIGAAAVGLIAATALSRTKAGKKFGRSAARVGRKLSSKASRMGRNIKRQAAATMPYVEDVMNRGLSVGPVTVSRRRGANAGSSSTRRSSSSTRSRRSARSRRGS